MQDSTTPDLSKHGLGTNIEMLEDATDPKEISIKNNAFAGHEEHAQIHPREERRLVIKLDAVLVPLASLIYFVAYLDRNCIGNARLMGLEKDLSLTPNQFYNCLAS
ncbi:hypothetical protein AYO21_07252 [Fonsecaea monophora]|uniref:Major facilitator superfamily (MFS) profile domain-containing protein n=1 Tax=Fonsecaea monophora TaxID=254056 RepID=A0A177F5E3_9EURO|nr:hypothetical protein AYO21_07252 [Fonsecaea monophora]OAG38592.1 hypothetical protein AYO21_07252 [Fonsecaea monophora]